GVFSSSALAVHYTFSTSSRPTMLLDVDADPTTSVHSARWLVPPTYSQSPALCVPATFTIAGNLEVLQAGTSPTLIVAPTASPGNPVLLVIELNVDDQDYSYVLNLTFTAGLLNNGYQSVMLPTLPLSGTLQIDLTPFGLESVQFSPNTILLPIQD